MRNVPPSASFDSANGPSVTTDSPVSSRRIDVAVAGFSRATPPRSDPACFSMKAR